MVRIPSVAAIAGATTLLLALSTGLTAQDIITLGEPKNPILGSVPPLRSVTVADYDGDGFDDLMLLTGARQEIAFNDGFGRFRDRVVVGNDAQNDEVAVDLDGDGILDRVRTGNASLQQFFKGLDGRSFAPPVALTGLESESGERVAPVFVDYDGDGDLDAISTGRPATLYQNDGSMNFSVVGDFVGRGTTIYTIKAADIDADGDVDFVARANGPFGSAAGTVLFENLGSGNIDLGGVSLWIQAVEFDFNDFDLDGDLDIVLPDRILENAGSGWPQIGLGVLNQLAVVSLDVNGDGLLDVATSDDEAVTVFRKLPTGGFEPATRLADSGLSLLSGGAGEPKMFAGRFDDSGREGFVTLGTERQPELFLPSSNGRLVETRVTFGQTLSSDITGNGIVGSADLNGDAFADFLFERKAPGSNFPTLALAFGLGGAVYEVIDVNVVPRASQFLRIESADLDGDGNEELLAVVRKSIGSMFRILIIDGDSPNSVTVQTLSLSDPIRNLGVADFDSDGLDDFVAASFSSYTLVTGNTSTLFQSRGTSSSPPLGDALFMDFDADGDTDIVSTFRPISILANDGSGNFTQVSTNLNLPAAASPGDLDGDGDEDLVVSDGTTRINETGGVFVQGPSIAGYPGTIASIPFPERALLDIDFDGDLDFLILEAASVNASGTLCLNDGNGRLTVNNLPGVADLRMSQIADARARDFDLDGDPDLVVGTAFQSRDAFSNAIVSRAHRVALSRSSSLRAPFLARSGSPYRVEVSSEPSLGSGPTLAFVGVSPGLLTAPLGPPTRGFLLENPVSLSTLVLPGPIGESAFSFDIPDMPSLAGSSFYVQAAMVRLDPSGTFDIIVTPAVRETIVD